MTNAGLTANEKTVVGALMLGVCRVRDFTWTETRHACLDLIDRGLVDKMLDGTLRASRVAIAMFDGYHCPVELQVKGAPAGFYKEAS